MAESLPGSQETHIGAEVVANYSGPTVHQETNSLDVNDESTSQIRGWISKLVLETHLHEAVVVCLARLRSVLDIKATVRFVVVIFSHIMGIATTFSVNLSPNRSGDALSSLGDDGYPIMIAQVVASMLSPLLFSIVSTKDRSTPFRQKIVSFYYLLLAMGVLMSFISLLLYSLWPSGYRITNLAIMASLMFAVLGGWQFLEKCWKETSESEDIELGQRQA